MVVSQSTRPTSCLNSTSLLEALVCTNQLQSQITLWRNPRQFGEVPNINLGYQCPTRCGNNLWSKPNGFGAPYAITPH